MQSMGPHPSSFRDPSGFLYHAGDGSLLRQVNTSYLSNYQQFMDSGLYEELVRNDLLIPHEEMPIEWRCSEYAARVLRPRLIPFISYPYEWPFEAFRAAALLTLDIQRRALQHGLWLKDASAYNVQFEGAHPVFIDTLSFEPLREGSPWPAYAQFCRHFLAPLALMAYADTRASVLMRTYLDGIPLDLASRLLPKRTWLRTGLLTHIHMHARFQTQYAARANGGKKAAHNKRRMGRNELSALLAHMETCIARMPSPLSQGMWAGYESMPVYAPAALEHKKRCVEAWLGIMRPAMVWDLGANTGQYSQSAAVQGAYVAAMDSEAACVERLYRTCAEESNKHILSLRMDLTNPSPACGWSHQERDSLLARGPADMALALALLHHLAIGNNVPLETAAAFLHQAARSLIIEFVPKEDPQVQEMLAARDDIFDSYTESCFESAFSRFFRITAKEKIMKSPRILYRMEAIQ